MLNDKFWGKVPAEKPYMNYWNMTLDGAKLDSIKTKTSRMC